MAAIQTFTPEQWARHEQFVQAFRRYKAYKREWEARMDVELSRREEEVRRRRAEVDALFDD